jgi:curved DNA-binding protein CbpA
VKTHYQLLGLEPSADVEEIKKAFRREIARYHPDKVIHLGQEFQEMAATRAAELTVAYKTLTDAAQRAEYDAGLGAPGPRLQPPPAAPDPAAPVPTAQSAPTGDPAARPEPPPPPGNHARFAAERADRDHILRRAIVARVREAVQNLHGQVETPAVRGFDLAIVPVAKPRFLGAHPPRVLVKVVDTADAASITESWGLAARARLHAGKSPVVVLLFANRIPPQQELSKANDAIARQPKVAGGPEEVAVIVVAAADWTCRMPPGCSSAVRKLAEQVCA